MDGKITLALYNCAMTTIYLIRHGQASIGAANYDVLSPLGQRQARVTGSHFSNIGTTFDAIYSGSLQRQIDTAEIALGKRPPTLTVNPQFNEYTHDAIFRHYAPVLAESNDHVAASLAGGSNTKLTYRTFSTLMNAWANDDSPHADIESWQQFNARLQSAIDTVASNHTAEETVAIFTSGGVICTLMQQAMQFPQEDIFALNWGIYNASISTLQLHNTQPNLRGYNNISHLELERDDSLITNI